MCNGTCRINESVLLLMSTLYSSNRVTFGLIKMWLKTNSNNYVEAPLNQFITVRSPGKFISQFLFSFSLFIVILNIPSNMYITAMQMLK